MAVPSIACIGVIGKNDDPVHIALFPPYQDARVEFSFLLNSCLDIIQIRRKHTSVDQDLGLLHAIDERLAAYGWLTTTGLKFLIVVDTVGRVPSSDQEKRKGSATTGLRDSDLKPAFRALQTAFIQLMQNPFYAPNDDPPIVKATLPQSGSGHTVTRKFIDEVKRIGDTWAPGLATV
ncbi:hypothetical protein DTO271G3_4227 [Paecilomyces variotii]|nr:hypothetical protein DTO271G3_4227 [Paecilomyces variotii]